MLSFHPLPYPWHPWLTRSLRFGDFHGIDLHGAEHVGAEDDPLAVGGDADVRLNAARGAGHVVVLAHVHQTLARHRAAGLRTEQVDPLAVLGEGHLAGIAAVAGEEFAVAGNVVMDGPPVALQFVADFLPGLDVDTRQPELL